MPTPQLLNNKNMSQYMVEIDLPEVLSPEFMALIPKQIETVNQLMTERVLMSYTLNSDRTKLWVTLVADSESEVITTISTFPLIKWMKFKTHELMFHHDSSAFIIPRMSLN